MISASLAPVGRHFLTKHPEFRTEDPEAPDSHKRSERIARLLTAHDRMIMI